MSRRIQTGPAPTGAVRGETRDGEAAVISFTDSEELTLGVAAKPEVHGALPHGAKGDGYIDRLLKYIPAEVIALYLGATNVVPLKDPSRWTAMWIITALCVMCTPLYIYIATRADGEPPLWSQVAISSVAFPVWVFAIGGPFREFPWYEEKQWIAAIIITFGTFVAGLYKPAPPAAHEAGSTH